MQFKIVTCVCQIYSVYYVTLRSKDIVWKHGPYIMIEINLKLFYIYQAFQRILTILFFGVSDPPPPLACRLSGLIDPRYDVIADILDIPPILECRY